MSADLRIDDYIKHIEDYATEAMVIIEGISKEEFLKDRKTQQAVTLNLITLGEISTVLKNKYPNFLEIASDIPWKDIAGMRHRLVHGYSEVDVIVVWDTVQEFVPKLIEAMPYVYKAVNEFKDKNINRDDANPEMVM